MVGVAAAALLPLAVAWRGTAQVEGALATRTATAVAGYLSAVAPPASPATARYDLAALHVIARGLVAVPGWTAPLEVYYGTTPLLSGGPSLDAEVLAALQRREAVWWLGREAVALAPLKDRDLWDVVGVVSAGGERPPADTRPSALALLVAAAGLAATLGRGSRRGNRGRWVGFAALAVLHGALAGGAVRRAAAWSSDRWLGSARRLVQEAAARQPRPGRAPLALAQRVLEGSGTEVVMGDSAGPAVSRTGPADRPRAVVAARLGPGRWAALSALPGERIVGGWLGLALGVALVGPALVALGAWGARAAARPRSQRETLTAWAFLAPAALPLAVFAFAPIGFAAWLALHRWSLLEPVRPFVGFENFAALARDPLTWISLRNTALYALYVPVTMVLALGVALALNRPGRWVRWVRVAFFLPYIASVVAVTLVWQWLFNADFGLLNWVLGFAGIPPLDWLGNPRTALLAVMLVSVWVQVGYQMTVFLAGLQGIPQTYLDAARVDGATAWQRFRRVTLPLLRPVTLFVLVTGIIGSFQVFTFVYVLTEGGPLHATDVIVYRIYQTAWEFLQFGRASALALLLFALLAVITWTQFRLLGRRVEHG